MSSPAALLAPLDALRLWGFRRLGRAAVPLVRDRELRVCVLGTSAVLGALALTLLAPLWLLALGPIALGVPHVIADVRYLVVRPALHRRPGLVLAAGFVLAAGLGAGAAVGLLAGVAAALVARAPIGRRALVAVALLAGAFALRAIGPIAEVVFAHAHNAVAVLCWLAWRPRASRMHLIVLALALAATSWLLSGAADALFIASRVLDHGPAALPLGLHVAQLAPDVAPPLAVRLVLAFAFAQALHYAVWLRLVPEEDRPRATPRSYRASYAALERDFGRPALLLFAALALAVAGSALLDVAAARDGYLRFALFHGHLEIAALAVLALEGRLCLPGRSPLR